MGGYRNVKAEKQKNAAVLAAETSPVPTILIPNLNPDMTRLIFPFPTRRRITLSHSPQLLVRYPLADRLARRPPPPWSTLSQPCMVLTQTALAAGRYSSDPGGGVGTGSGVVSTLIAASFSFSVSAIAPAVIPSAAGLAS